MSTESTPEPTSEAAFFTAIRSWGIVRGDQRVFGGVLSGVGARIGMAPAPARIIFVVLAVLAGGLSLIGYAAAWALLPDADGRIVIQDFGRGRPNVGALVAIGVVALVGFITLGQFGTGSPWRSGSFHFLRGDDIFGTGLLGTSWATAAAFMFALLVPIAVVGGIVFLIVWSVRHGKSGDRAAQGFARRPDGTIPDAPAASAVPFEAGQSASPAEPALVPNAVATAKARPIPAQVAQPQPLAPVPPAPVVYSAPPRPPKPRVPGPGKVGYLLALAWIPITIAITIYLSANDKLAVFPALAAGVIYVAGLGVILMITALRGRKLGFLGFVSVMALIPVGVAIAAAPEIREHYADDTWFVWGPSYDSDYAEPSYSASPVEPEAPAFDPARAFYDYTAVAIAGQCSDDFTGPAPTATGNISLSEVTGPTTLTVATDTTRVVIPKGTSLKIVSTDEQGYDPYVGVTWVDRGITCSMTSGVKDVVTLNNPDAPVLTLELGDPAMVGQFDIYIEEN